MNRRIAVALTLLGAVLVIVATSRPWARVTVSGLPSLNDFSVSGRRIAPAGLPVALAAGAGAFVLAISGRIVRLLVGAVLLLAGAALAVNGFVAGRGRSGVVHKALEDSLGIVNRSGGTAGDSLSASAVVHQNALYLLYVVGGVVILVAGLFTLMTGRSWAATGRRFERSVPDPMPVADSGSATDDGAGTGTGTDTDTDTPSTEPSPAVGARRSLARASGRAGSSNAPADVWDALSRGEDPTSSADDPT